MALPLVVLAFLALVGGLLNLPFKGTHHLETWLEPVFGEHGEHLHHLTLSASTKLSLAALATAASLLGIGVAYLIYLRHKVREETVEPAVLRRAWYVDPLYARIIEAPGRTLATFSANVADSKVIDGAVNGMAALVRAGGSRLRVLQSGYVRNYALAVASGAALVLGYVVVRAGG